jgi:16S rRNA (guanine1207-N2)-methyltransferase
VRVKTKPSSIFPTTLEVMYNKLMAEDIYFHKTVAFRAGQKSLVFRTSQELFSSHDIDVGTRFLLRTITEASYPGFQRILDVGCGYGALGLTLKSLHPDSTAQLVDRDALAVAYSLQNAELNGLGGMEIYGSLGYDDVSGNNFDLIISNIPGKAGETVIAYLLREAQFYLKPGGVVVVVVVAPLEEMVTKILAETPGAEMILTRKRSSHAVFHYRFSGDNTPPKPALSALERGVYHRQKVTVRLDNLAYAMQTAYGLPEFDSLSYASEMLMDALKEIRKKDISHAVVFNPGQGHVPVALWKLFRPQYITLVDRDLLALRYSRLNLTSNGCPLEKISVSHQVGIELKSAAKADLVIGVLREEASQKANSIILDQATTQLSPGGMIILSAGSTAITRLVDYVASQGLLRTKTRERRRGYSLLALERV